MVICCLIHIHVCNTHSLEEYGDGIGLATYPLYSWMSITHKSEKTDSGLSGHAQDFQDTIDEKQNKLMVKYKLS